jgi:hypothetical protein
MELFEKSFFEVEVLAVRKWVPFFAPEASPAVDWEFCIWFIDRYYLLFAKVACAAI